MIRLENITCSHRTGAKSTLVLDDVSVTLPTDRRFVVLGHSGSGKSTLIRLLSSSMIPDHGFVTRSVRVSYPVGFRGGLTPSLSPKQNIEYACDIYDADYEEVLDFVARVTGFSKELDKPFSGLSTTSRIKFAFALSYAMPFDTYLIDGAFAGGDRNFRGRCLQMLEARLAKGGMIMATSQPRVAAMLGDSGAVLYGGKLYVYNDIKIALARFAELGPDPVARGEIEIDGDLDDEL